MQASEELQLAGRCWLPSHPCCTALPALCSPPRCQCCNQPRPSLARTLNERAMGSAAGWKPKVARCTAPNWMSCGTTRRTMEEGIAKAMPALAPANTAGAQHRGGLLRWQQQGGGAESGQDQTSKGQLAISQVSSAASRGNRV